MTSEPYWKNYYVIKADADEIEKNIKHKKFCSAGKDFDLVCFEENKNVSNILISPGSGGHAYVFAELGYYMHGKGYNVFIMPKHGGFTIKELMQRHEDALKFISGNYNERIGVFAEGLGGYSIFYLSLMNELMKSCVYMNAPVIVTEKKFQDAWMSGNGAAKRRKRIFPIAKLLYRFFPGIKFPICFYLDFKEMVDNKQENRIIEAPLIERFSKDHDFDRRYPLSAIMSLVYTSPPKPISELKVPTMFLVPVRGFFPFYEKNLFNRLPEVKKKIVEVDGGVFWMLSHPEEAANVICEWFKETL